MYIAKHFVFMKNEHAIRIAIFLIVIWAPIVDNLFSIDPIPPLQEFRTFIKWPDVETSWKKGSNYLGTFETYFKDNLGFRKILIQNRGILLYKWLGVSSLPEKVLIGKNGWMYNNTPYYTEIRSFDNRHLEMWQHVFEKNRDYLKKQGIDYFVIIVPSKGSIYPEFLPSSVDFFSRNPKQNQFIQFLKNNSDVNIISLKEFLREKKKDFQLYYAMDHHWNDIGAFFAYQEILDKIRNHYPNVPPALQLSDVKIHDEIKWSPSFARMLGLNNIIKKNKVTLTIEKQLLSLESELLTPANYNEELEWGDRWNKPIVAAETKQQDLPSVLMIHDSFGNYLRPYLAEHFNRSVFCSRRRYNQVYEKEADVIKREHPDILIQQIWETHLSFHPFDIVRLYE